MSQLHCVGIAAFVLLKLLEWEMRLQKAAFAFAANKTGADHD